MQLAGALVVVAQKRVEPVGEPGLGINWVGSTVALHVVWGAIENDEAFAPTDTVPQPV